MKNFRSNKPLKIILRDIEKHGWKWEPSKFNDGDDWIVFHFEHTDNGLKYEMDVLYNSFTGAFMTRYGDHLITETNPFMEGESWYDALCDFLYEPAKESVAA